MNEFLETAWDALRERPWLLIAVYVLPLVVLGHWKRIFPHTPLVIALAAPALLSFGVLVNSDLIVLIAVLDGLILLVAALDLLTLPAKNTFQAERDCSRIASIAQNHRITLTISNLTRWRRAVHVRDDFPQDFTPSVEEFAIRLGPRSRAVMHYELKANRRGEFFLDSVYLRVRSLFGLWRRYMTYPVQSVIHVYPDMKQLAEYAILARSNRLSLMGVRRTRKIGQDNEFERLRDYTLDDNYKHIDWRSTARRRKLTVKDFQTNQSQRIIFLLDCGRMMTNLAGKISLLDHSLNAMLMMSFVALRQGDQVGLICFSDTIHNYVPPRGGMKQMNQLLHASFNRFPNLVESRYDQAFLYLSAKCSKRSLVVMITNLIDEVNSHQLEQYLGTLVGHHLPLGVLLRDRGLFDIADSPHAHRQDMIYRAAAAAEILTWRHQVLTDLEHKGVLTIDAFAEDMTAKMVNRYLEIKARHLL